MRALRRERDQAIAGATQLYLDTALQEPAVASVITFGLSDRYTWLQEFRNEPMGSLMHRSGHMRDGLSYLASNTALLLGFDAIVGAGDALAVADLAVRGADLIAELGLTPGPAIGRILATLLDEVLTDPAGNTRPGLLARARVLLPPA